MPNAASQNACRAIIVSSNRDFSVLLTVCSDPLEEVLCKECHGASVLFARIGVVGDRSAPEPENFPAMQTSSLILELQCRLDKSTIYSSSLFLAFNLSAERLPFRLDRVSHCCGKASHVELQLYPPRQKTMRVHSQVA
jgi:hypothetical protein